MSLKASTNKSKLNLIILVLLVVFVFTTIFLLIFNDVFTQNSIDSDTRQSDSSTNKTSIFNIPELGIKFELTEELTGLKYIVNDASSDEGIVSVLLSTSSLENLDDFDRCTVNNAAIGILQRTFINPGSGENPLPGRLYIKINDYYIVYYKPQQPCSSKDDANQLQIKQSEAMLAIINNIKEDK